MESIEDKKRSLTEEFSLFDEWLDKYEYLIELGKGLPAYPEQDKTDEHLIKGCQSRVWLSWELRDGALWFNADSDAVITRGIISLLIRVYSGEAPSVIAADDFAFGFKLGNEGVIFLLGPGIGLKGLQLLVEA